VRTKPIEKRSWEVLSALLTSANALVVEVMLATGLRVSDVLAFRTSGLRQRFTVMESKTGKRKQIYLGKDLLARLQAQAGTEWVFPGQRDPSKHRTRQAVWTDVKRASRAMRLPMGVAPHSARKSYAVDEYRKCGDIEAVKRKLNHDRLETTVLYLLSEFKRG